MSTTTIPIRATFTGAVTGTITLDIVGDLTITADVPEPPEPPGPPPFVMGETPIDDTTVGAGVIRPYPTHQVSEPTTYAGVGHNVTDTEFLALVTVEGPGWVFENCAFRGPVSGHLDGMGANLISTTKADLVEGIGAVLRYCDLNPITPGPYWNGVGYQHYRLEQCHVWGAIDALAAFASSDDPDPAVHVQVLGSWLERLAQFKPDVAGNRDVTHNDLIQAQGNDGPDDDIWLDYCRLDAYHSADQSDPTPPEHTQIAAVMLSPSTQDRVAITLTRCTLSGGVYTLNAGAGSLSDSSLTLVDNVWEKPRPGGPSKAIAVDPGLTDRTISGNVYPDGSPVPISGAL